MADIMAASSGGVDWSAVIKPLLSQESEICDRKELLKLCSTIIKCESEILRHTQDTSQNFFHSFTTLAADFICNNAIKLSAGQLEVVIGACRVLLKFQISSLSVPVASETGHTENHSRIEKCIKSIQALCFGTKSLSPIEVTSLINIMKGETPPMNIPTPTDKDAGTTQDRESSKSRFDLSVSILEQLTLPLYDGRPVATETIAQPDVGTSDPAGEINRLFLKANVESLQGIKGGEILVDLCLSLPSIKKAHAKIEEALAGKAFSLPVNYVEATAVRNSLPSVVADVTLASSAINLPILEPLSLTKLDKLCNLSMAVLYCAVSQAAAGSVLAMGSAISPKCSAVQSQSNHKEEDLDANAVTVVEEALNMFSHIGTTIKNSTRAGGQIFQNYLMAGSWVLISGLQMHVSSCTAPDKSPHLRDEKGRSPSKSRESTGSARSSLLKFQQSFGVLSVALAERALTILSELFEDLHLEVSGGAASTLQSDPAPISIAGQFTALQRVARVLNAAPINQLFFYLAIVSYRKACTLKRIHPPEGDTFSQSDSTTYYEDMIICSDVSTDEDDDSEPILGQWFEETLAPPETNESKNSNTEEDEAKQDQADRGNSVVPEKGEANGFITLATNIFVFFNRHLLSSKCPYIARYLKTGFTEQQIIILAAIIRDLDKETSRTDVGTISVYFGQTLGQLYSEFSGALTRFTHNLVTHPSLQPLQANLLGHLGVSPWNTDVPHAWPLQVYPRTLAVLAQVLLLRPQNEKEASVISIWHRLVNTLIENVLSLTIAIADGDVEDLNVEHAQVLVYLFHSLNLMQKKSVVLLMAGGVLRCSEIARGPLRESQLLHLSRLLLLFDYIMKHLYDTPQVLLEQIQFNLFHSTHLNVDKDKENNMSRMYTPWKDIEAHYLKNSGEEFSMKPCFYMLSNMETNNQDAPKLDGLACNFVLGTPDKFRYHLLLDALTEILNVTHISKELSADKMSSLWLCATQYCFSICWKLLLLLPPSTLYLERLSLGESLTAGPLLLHSLILGPRCGNKNFARWLKDCLIKQGIYTQHTEKLLKSVSDAVNCLKYDVTNAKNCIIALTPDIKKGLMSKESLPPLWHLYTLHSVIAKVQVSLLDEAETNQADANGTTTSTEVYVQDLMPHILRLTQTILHCTRWSLLYTMAEQSDQNSKCSVADMECIHEVLAISSSKNGLINGLASEQSPLLPQNVTTVLQQWNNGIVEEISWIPYLTDIIVSESFILKIIDSHVSTLSSSFPYSINLSLKHLLQCLMKFICQYAPKIDNTDTKNKAIELLVAITLDTRTEFLYENVSKTLDKMIGDSETDEHQKRVYTHILENTYKLITNYTNNTNININEKILHNFLKFYEKIIEKSSGRQAHEYFFTGENDLVKVLMSVSNQQMSHQYSTRVLHFFNKLFQAAEKSPSDPSLNYLCRSMSKLAQVDSDKLQTWLRHVIIGPSNMINMISSDSSTPTATKCESSIQAEWADTTTNVTPSASDDIKSLVQENSQLLQALTNFIVKQSSNVSEDVATVILKALLPLGTHILASSLEGTGFTDLMVVMTMLADAGKGRGHVYLFPETAKWLENCNKYLGLKDVVDKLSNDPKAEKNCVILEAACCMLDYMSDVINGILSQAHVPLQRPLSPPWENETPLEQDVEFLEEPNDEDDSGDESDEDSLCNKLCTFTVTQKEFMNQHWYHCHTCRMLDGVGVCSICARVCHKGHDITYSKYGNFFCDCGAKEDGSCQALVKRSPQSLDTNISSSATSTSLGFIGSDDILPSALRRRESPVYKRSDIMIRRERKKHSSVKQLEGCKEWIFNYLGDSTVPSTLIELLKAVLPAVDASCGRNSPVGCYSRAMKALQLLHSADKKYLGTDQLMLPTLGSQEGAFENVRMSYAGEQGQTIRQMLSAHVIRRVTMCCMSSPLGKRQHLAVAHEKGKITVLQLSALLKQADSSTRKLTLTRLASAPIPFTVLSLSSNLCNEDYLAVCGLKDCHVLTFASSGSVTDHLVLHPQLESGNFIIKALWLPGSQTKMALVTADFVKIYDLAKDALSPQYYFLVPSGKIRDCTFMYENGSYNILLMSSPGHIYTETLNEESSAKHGSFYVTNTLEVFHLDVIDVNGQVAGGGVSIYYSHTLGLLFYSYAQGKSFISPVTPHTNCLTVVYSIVLPPASKGNGGKTPAPQPLCQWTEIPNHPGLICCAMQSSNNPIVLMLKPECLAIQEIKVVPPKSKIMDMVAIRHNHSLNEQRTTLILLCEDGSLKMYMANMDHTGYWMSPNIQPSLPVSAVVRPKKKKLVKTNGKTPSAVSFPVDFFEHCTVMNDVDIGGNDLLQIYNVGQLKHRLSTNGLYVVCTKAVGFTVEITNTDNNMVMTGIRVLIGTQDPQKAPTFVDIFGRIITTTAKRSRWFDIPFSREESLQADKKMSIGFGPSQDPETVTLLENLKVYGKTKESFGWPEETEDVTALPSITSGNGNGNGEGDNPSSSTSPPLTKLDKFVSGMLDVLDGSFCLYANDDKMKPHAPSSMVVATKLLTLPTPPTLQIHSTSLLSALHPSSAAYHSYKDQALLNHVLASLTAMTEIDLMKNKHDLDAESYYRLVLIVRGIAVSRPQNLVKFADSHTSIQDVVLDDPLDVKTPTPKSGKNQHLLLQLMDVLWLLHSLNPENTALAPVVVPGLKHTDQVIFALVEIVHAFNSCDTYSNITLAVYLQLLLSEDTLISFSAKHALSQVMKPKIKKRRVCITNPPICATPSSMFAIPNRKSSDSKSNTRKEETDSSSAVGSEAAVSVPAPPLRQDPQPNQAGANNVNPLEAFLGDLFSDIPMEPDETETMVEFAIALSLQEHVFTGEQVQQALQGLPALAAGNFSDTTASAGGSDDEGSTAATDGSTLRTSPAEQAGSGGSESGGSGLESITGEHNVSGRSSAYGDSAQESSTTSGIKNEPIPSTSANYHANPLESENTQELDSDDMYENSGRLHILRLQLLERLIEYMPKIRNITGVRSVPFFQVISQLTVDLDGNLERDRTALDALLNAIIVEMQTTKPNFDNICQRTNSREVQLVILRLLTVLMTRWKSTTGLKPVIYDNSSYVVSRTATVLYKADFIPFCLRQLQSLLDYWKQSSHDDHTPGQVSGNLLKEHLHEAPPDMSPIFLKQFVKGHASDVFRIYPQLLTEMSLRLPYQIQKHSEIEIPIGVAYETAWFKYLCEYMMYSHVPFIRRLVRKLLLFICGSKDKYRQLRDIHALNAHMKAVRHCCLKGGFNPSLQYQHAMSLSYDTLVDMVEHLKCCLEIAVCRVGNWQKFCIGHTDIISFLLQVSCILDEGVAPTILQLLNCAIVLQTGNKKTELAKAAARKDREKSDDSIAEALFEQSCCVSLVEQINQNVSKETLARFIRTFILETNHTTLRWQAHSLILSLYKNSKLPQKESLLELLWKLWPLLPTYGRKAAQFVDLLGFFSLKISQNPDSTVQISSFVDKAVDVLRVQNELLSHHPNANLYAHMAQYVELEGYYLESDPCFVCNNPEVPLSTIKLSSIKVDSKFTTTTQIIKLLSSHTISRITIRIGDLKRTKMVRVVNIYYNNRNVQAVVELKNKPALWHKAKKVNVQSGQTEIKIEFPLPIVACNLMIEYADFFENIQASSETLQCPRCSAAVPAHPGICSNCGENVYQCHKCRAINYDEKDPFLCHACGFCKYAKFDFTLQAKPCCAVEPIETDDDRKKMVSSINTLLEKADRVYEQLMGNKPSLEQLVLKVSEQRTDRKHDEPQATPAATTAAAVVGSSIPTAAQVKVNKTIQMIAQQYCNESKTSFEELSKIIQKVLVSRKELVAYDRRHQDSEDCKSMSSSQISDLQQTSTCSVTRCYGCSTAATEHCLTLLRALAINITLRQVLCSKGLIQELLTNNLRKGSVQIQEEVRQLLCILSKDNSSATEELCSLITERVYLGLSGQTGDLGIRHEIALLASLQQIQDNCWETRLRCLVHIFLKACKDAKSPLVIEAIILPCLQIWHNICKPKGSDSGSKSKTPDKSKNGAIYGMNDYESMPIDVLKWINKDTSVSHIAWSAKMSNKKEVMTLPTDKTEVRKLYLLEKYANKWRQKTMCLQLPYSIDLQDSSWVKTVLFNQSSALARKITCDILQLCACTFSRRKQIVLMLTSYLSELSIAGENAKEYVDLYSLYMNEVPWKQFLVVKNVHITLAQLITQQIEQLHRLEETSLTTDLTQGFALTQLTELLVVFIIDEVIKRQHKGKLLGAVLNGYLSLRRLVVQRTRWIDHTQEKLLDILEELTSGTEEETRAFMCICIETVEKYTLQDVLTPVFIFERLCSIIFPEDNDIGEFFLTLEKDQQQEEFLQGRMLGNPYSSLEAGLGPLMRDVKNKICQDCELVALLEDDNGMELLVNNKIMSLDLPVKDVYKKVWIAEGGEVDSMRVVYRMRGLLGDATEEFIETLNNKLQATVDNEEVYKMANVLAECDGLKVMVRRLGAIQKVSRAKPLLQVLLKLFRLSVKVVKVQEVLTDPELGAMEVFLRTLQLCLEGESDSSQAAVTEQLLDIMETVLSKATSKSLESFMKFSQTFGGPEYVQSLLSCTNHTSVRNNQSVLIHLTRVLAALVYGSSDKMMILLDHFKSALDFNKYDYDHTTEDQQKLEMFCVLTDGIEMNAIGNTLKDKIIALDIVKDALDYITMHASCVKPTLLMRTDSDELKAFISKPALKYILRFLTGMANSHENTQLALSEANTIPIIHRLEQVSSDEHVGSLAENLLEALMTNDEVATKIQEVREFTRSEKKRLAMAMREKQLGQLGMRTNDRGQVTAKSTILQQMEELGEETGLICCICREGYKYQPSKVLAIYTFTKRCNVEEAEIKARKTVGYSTVTHFNIVHVDCHMSAVRLARERHEWESAALQNANTKCNGLLPLWGPQVAESAFASCLARHNSYLQESTNHRDIGHSSTIHDLKLLLLRFAQEKPFHEDTGGGGPQSNMHMVPYLIHMALYVVNTTRVSKKEETNLNSYLEQSATEKIIESCYEPDGPLYWITMSMLLQSSQKWSQNRLAHLKRLVVLGHVRSSNPLGLKNIFDKTVKEYVTYRPYLIFFGLIDGIYNNFFKTVSGPDDLWPTTLADFIRHNDEALLKGSERLLGMYIEELLPCASFSEFCDVAGLLDVISEPENYISDVIKGI
ncbi:PREDICTED: E3 ubiquitin-protein ligase UBR4 [Nicrophorus vespilloides]|uniref:E3 ubiquitin-protein ligase UBR4 n=1 Tax=Nicrophorus vespilloides TaxID=110193 RepID=A0ABM1N9T3_NICVS|nr:PREDICTED: E3 ubiquitin-protein ligase UBR4 [Nicrophorus vespilloides]